ncbi:MAG: hypothetical protein QXD48_03870 [Candidatus Aenigmatarchaeota archaeon]
MIIENIIAAGIEEIFGNMVFVGLFILVTIISMIVFLKFNEIMGAVIFIPACILAAEFIPGGKIIVALASGIIFSMALLKLIRR